MKNPTKTERIIHALRQHIPELREIESNSSKCRTFQGPKTKYFVGKSGGLRAGGNRSNSFSLEMKVPGLLAKYPHPDFDPRIEAFETLQSAMRHLWVAINQSSTLPGSHDGYRDAYALVHEKAKELRAEIKGGKQ